MARRNPMPDLAVDYTVVIEEGRAESVAPGTPAKARLLVVMLSETMNRIYYEETTAAIESIAGRVKIKGNETERRRMLRPSPTSRGERPQGVAQRRQGRPVRWSSASTS